MVVYRQEVKTAEDLLDAAFACKEIAWVVDYNKCVRGGGSYSGDPDLRAGGVLLHWNVDMESKMG